MISKIQESNYETAKQELVKGILNAFSEIEQLLEQNQSLSIQNNALEVALKQSKDAYDLSKERYDKGVTTHEQHCCQYNVQAAGWLAGWLAGCMPS